FTSAEEEAVGPGQLQSATERRLPADAVGLHPSRHPTRTLDDQGGQVPVDPLTCHIDEVGQELFLGVALPHQPDVAGVLAVAASPLGAGLLEHLHPRAAVGCSQRGTEGGVATPNHQDVQCLQLAYIVTVESGTTLFDTITRRCYTGPSR